MRRSRSLLPLLLKLAPLAGLAGLGGVTACAPSATGPAPKAGNLHAAGVGSREEPTVWGARILPESADGWPQFGYEPGGGVRAMASGQRVTLLPQGGIAAAESRLPSAMSRIVPLPERLGGGFLFLLGNTLHRADTWLGPVRAIYTHHTTIANVFVGLDRVYFRTGAGAHQALDPRTGDRVDLGPFPQAPFVGPFGAVDGWRAIALTDTRGAVLTQDAGVSWRPLPLGVDPKRVVIVGNQIAVSGLDASKKELWFEVRPDGQTTRIAGDPTPPAAKPAGAAASDGPFGARPLVAAIEDGWPLADGTAVVARDGALGRVRLSDGALLDTAKDAYPQKPSRCHAFSLTRPAAKGAFGFACGEPRGPTTLYAYEPMRGAMREIARFDRPRVVVSSANGAVIVHGGCKEDDRGGKDGEHAYCILSHDNVWREVRLKGDIGQERVVALGDGRVVILSPPMGDLAAARLTVLDKGRATTRPVVLPTLTQEQARVLKLGVWMEGFEDRRSGEAIGGWVEAGGTMLGVEVALDGRAKVGQYVRDAGSPIVSGRYGLGWTAAKRGYETTDGGMTWTPFDAPEPIADKTVSRSCGPIGCAAQGWLRVGWGEADKTDKNAAPAPYRAAPGAGLRALELDCVALAGAPKEPPKPAAAAAPPPVKPPPRPSPAPTIRPPQPSFPSTPFPAFYTVPAPLVPDGDRGLSYEATLSLDASQRLGPYARVYGWGPKGVDWDSANARWQIRWLSPFAGWSESRTSSATSAPPLVTDAARAPVPGGYYPSYYSYYTNYTYVVGDDPSHALLLAKRSGKQELQVFALEADHPPLEIKRADGEPIVEIDAAVREGGKWYFTTPPAYSGDLPNTTVWQVEGAQAREKVRVPRLTAETRGSGVKLARRTDGRALGLVVDGQPGPDRSSATRWVLPIDVETGRTGEPESLGVSDLSDRGGALGLCKGGEDGWILDATTPVVVRVRMGGELAGNVNNVLARLRVTSTTACVERLAGMLDNQSPERAAVLATAAKAKPAREPHTFVTVTAARNRYALACSEPEPKPPAAR